MARKKRMTLDAYVNNGCTHYDQNAETLHMILETLKRIESRLKAMSSSVIQHPYLSMQKLPPQEYKKLSKEWPCNGL